MDAKLDISVEIFPSDGKKINRKYHLFLALILLKNAEHFLENPKAFLIQ
jgi:hypothetical protein